MPVASAPIRSAGSKCAMADGRKRSTAMRASGHAWREPRSSFQPLGGELGCGVGRGMFGRCGGDCRVGEFRFVRCTKKVALVLQSDFPERSVMVTLAVCEPRSGYGTDALVAFASFETSVPSSENRTWSPGRSPGEVCTASVTASGLCSVSSARGEIAQLYWKFAAFSTSCCSVVRDEFDGADAAGAE